MYLMVLERKTEYFQESKLIANEERREQADNNLKAFLLLELINFKSDTECLSQSPCSVIFPTTVNKGILCPRQAYAWSSLSTLPGFEASKMSRSRQTHYQSKIQWSNEPIIDANHVQPSRGHSTVQAGELGSKSKTVFQVKRVNLNRPNKEVGRLTGHSVHLWSNKENHPQ